MVLRADELKRGNLYRRRYLTRVAVAKYKFRQFETAGTQQAGLAST